LAYENAIFYFMTGTGNSYRAATWMGEEAKANGADVCLYAIEEAQPKSEIKSNAKQLIGFIFPTHGFTAPWKVIHFALLLPRRIKTHAFVVATRAGSKIGSSFFPGLEGTACYLIAFILFLKGYSVRGIMGLDMPSNWMALHPGFHPKTAEPIIARAKIRITRFMEEILANRYYITGIIPFILGLCLLPISFGYLVFGRFFLAKIFFASNRCNGCGLCAQNCSFQAIKMLGDYKPRPYWTFLCESCMRCMAFCPKQAIEAGHSWAFIFFYILHSVIMPPMLYLCYQIIESKPGLAILNHSFFGYFLYWIIGMSYIMLGYMIFALLMRIPIVNSFFTYTTFTHVYRRYHEPGTSLKDIGGRGKIKR